MSAGAAELTNSGVPVPNVPPAAPAVIAVSRVTPVNSAVVAARTRTREGRMSAPGWGRAAVRPYGSAYNGSRQVMSANVTRAPPGERAGGGAARDVGSTTCEPRGRAVDPGAGADQALRHVHGCRRHRLPGSARRGLRLSRSQRRRQELDDADGRSRVARERR